MRAPSGPLGQRRGGLLLPRGRGFGSGAAHPSAVAAAAGEARRACKAAEKGAARAMLEQRYHPDGLPATQSGGRTCALSEHELRILKLRSEAPGPRCVAAWAAELGRAPSTIYRGLKRLREPATPPDEAEKRRRRGGGTRLLTPEMNATLRAAIKKDPVGGPPEAAKVLFEMHGVNPSRWTIGRELCRMYRPGDKRIRRRGTERYAPMSDQLMSMHLGHCKAMDLRFHEFDFDGVFWQDEAPFVPGCASHQGYGGERIFLDEKHSRYGSGEKVTLWGVMSVKGWTKLWVTAENGNDDVCRRFFCDLQSDAMLGGDKPLFELIGKGGILLVDRLGRSGRCKFPIAGHYQPEIKAAANAAGCGYAPLAPGGACENPCENAWLSIKQIVAKMRPPGNPEDARQQIIRGPRTMAEALPMILAAALQMNATEGLFRSFIHRRGAGAEFLARYEDTEALERAEASLAGRPPFVLAELAGRPRLVNIHSSDDEPLTTVAQRASYFRYFMANVRAATAVGLAPPGPADEPGADGFEDRCRACARTRVSAKAAPHATATARGLLLTCERRGCTAAYHPTCLGLAGVPAGRWVCPGCTHAPGVAPRAVAVPSGPARENLLADLTDDE